MNHISLSPIFLVALALTSACSAIRPSHANVRSDRPEIFFTEKQSTWVGVTGPVSTRSELFMVGTGFGEGSTVVCGYKGFESVRATRDEGASASVYSCPLRDCEGRRLLGVWITPAAAATFDGSEMICLKSLGCARPQKKRRFRPVRIYEYKAEADATGTEPGGDSVDADADPKPGPDPTTPDPDPTTPDPVAVTDAPGAETCSGTTTREICRRGVKVVKTREHVKGF
jgi:hypothetical protein